MARKAIQFLLIAALISAFTITVFTDPKSTLAYTFTGDGSPGNPYVINSVEDFQYFAESINRYNVKHFKLGKDLDFSSGGFTAFGIKLYPFKGTFDGNGYTIYNPTKDASVSEQGIFGATEGATIKNVKVKNVNFQGSNYIGGLIGSSSNTTIINSSVEGGIIKGDYIGGLVGYMAGGSISNSYVNVTVSGGYQPTGGLVGFLASGTITNSFFGSTGSVTGKGKVGGLVGSNYGTIRESFAYAKVENTNTDKNSITTGGLVGENNGTIENSYARGSVKGNKIGGLVGIHFSGTIKNSYAANQLIADSNNAGGITYQNSSTITNSYWDTNVTGRSSGYILNNNGTFTNSAGKSTSDMQKQSTYTGWDFNTTWSIQSNAYPYLKKANLIELDSSERKVSIEAGKSKSVKITAIFSNGTKTDVTNSVTVALINLPGVEFSKTNGNIILTGNNIANGYIKVTYNGVSNQFPVTITPGPVDVNKSTVVADKTSIVADGETTSKITVTVVDEWNHPKSGLSVSLKEVGGVQSTITPVKPTTDQNGKAEFTVKSTNLGTAKFSAEVVESGQNKKIVQEATVGFEIGPPNASKSSITVATTGPYVVGKDPANLKVTIKDLAEHAIQGAKVELIPNPKTPSNFQTTITTTSDITDANGTATFNIFSTWAQTINFTVKVNGTEMSALSTSVTFVPDEVDGNQSIIDMTTNPIRVGESREFLVRLKDQYGNDILSGGQSSTIEWDSSIKDRISLLKDNGNGTYTYTYTAPTTAGTDTIRGSVAGTQMNNTITLTAIPDSVAKAIIEPEDRNVTVGQELLVTMTLRDQYDNLVEQQPVTLLQKNGTPTTISAVNGGKTSNGIVQFKVSSTKTEKVTYEIEANGNSTGLTFEVQFLTSSIDTSKTVFTQDKESAIADDQDYVQLMITLQDQYGNPIPNTKVNITAPTGSSAVPSQMGIDTTDVNGNVSFDLKSTVAGERTFRIGYVDGDHEEFLKEYDVTFTAGNVDLGKSSVTVTKQTVTADGIDATELLIVLKDQYQNPVPNKSVLINTSNTNVKIDGVTNPTNSDGEAHIKITNLVAEKVQLTIKIDDFSDDIEITFVPGEISKSASKVTIDSTIIEAADSTTITVRVTDSHGNAIPNQKVTLQQTGNSMITPLPEYIDGDSVITDNTGAVKFIVTSTKAETVVYTAVVTDENGNEITINTTVTLTIASGKMYVGNSEMTVSHNRLVADGMGSVIITVQLKDEFGNNLTADGGTIDIYANSDQLTVSQAVYGIYTAELNSPTVTGKVVITANYHDEDDNPLLLPVREEIVFIPGPADVETSTIQASKTSMYADGTSQARIIVQLKDQYYNDLTDDTIFGNDVEITTDIGSISATQYIGDGQYEAILTASTEIGEANLTATLNGDLIHNSVVVDFTLGPLSLAKTTITADQTALLADGRSTAVITVQLMDDYGHKIESDEGTVVLTTTLGTISQADYVKDGMYQATFTAGTTIGQAVITGTLNGDPLLEKAEVRLAPIYYPAPPTESNTNQKGTDTTGSVSDEEITSDQPIIIETNWDHEGTAELSLPSSTLQHILELNPSQSIEVQVGNIAYQLPVELLNSNEIAELLGDQDFEVIIQFQTANDDVVAAAQSTAEQLGAEMLVSPVEFTITIKAQNGNSIDFATFTQYVTRSFVIDDYLDTYYVTGVRFNPDTGEYEAVPTTFERQGNKTIVHLHSLSNSYYTVIKNAIRFVDMDNHWAKTEVERMANKLIIKGKGNQIFDPTGTVTRAEAITLLVRALGLNKVSEPSPYTDLENTWYTNAVHSAYHAGLIVNETRGGNSNLLKPNENITREELIVMFSKAMSYVGKAESRVDVAVLSHFKDVDAISDWAVRYVEQAVSVGVVKGDDLGNLKPKSYISRAEVAVMIDRLLKVLGISN